MKKLAVLLALAAGFGWAATAQAATYRPACPMLKAPRNVYVYGISVFNSTWTTNGPPWRVAMSASTQRAILAYIRNPRSGVRYRGAMTLARSNCLVAREIITRAAFVFANQLYGYGVATPGELPDVYGVDTPNMGLLPSLYASPASLIYTQSRPYLGKFRCLNWTGKGPWWYYGGPPGYWVGPGSLETCTTYGRGSFGYISVKFGMLWTQLGGD